ncbi:peptide chain release factor 3 [Echria macrotheca]|uniref:Peptide chain release factor 3 n=1 Tax=Echria macrotheca TaxID=438768 RepID=A0AAJ0F5K2_9PEZI|nr:peptide chain release factor 3 [Echria macrotheca]
MLLAVSRGGRLGHPRLLSVLRPRSTALSHHIQITLPLVPTRHVHGEQLQHDTKTEGIRNIGIIAHVDAGKTTTTERMLYHSGLIRHIGNVDHGDTTTDFLPLERERGITIQSAAITFLWPPRSVCPPGQQPKTINLIDTPGHQDFRYEVDRCLPILDGAVCILDSVKGVETHTERVWQSAQLSRIPRLIYVNKLDRDGASFKRSVLEAAARLRTTPLVCQIPWWNKDEFIGVVDVVNGLGMRFSSTGALSLVSAETIEKENPALRAEMDQARLSLVETLSEHDDTLMTEFLELEEDVSADSIKQAIRRLVMDGEARFAPVFAGSSLRNIGVQPLLDAVVDYLPNPSDRPELEVISAGKTYPLSDLLKQAAAKGKKGHNHQPPIVSLAHVFKVVDDPRRGMLSFARVYHGTLSRNSQMWNSNIHGYEKAQSILHVSAKDYQEIQHLATGHIGAMTGLKSARTGDTLLTFPGHQTQSAPEAFRNVRIKTVETPPAVAFIAIEPYSKTAGEKLEDALKRLTREDPSIRWNQDDKTGQLIMSGMGLLHLEVAKDRLLTHYKIDKDSALWGDIQVEYSECPLASTAPHRNVYDRSLRDKIGKAACTVSIDPLEAHHHETMLESSVERDGNIIHVTIPLPEDSDAERLPFDPEVVRQQLLNGAIAGLARGPRRSAPVRRCHVDITFDPETDFFGAASTGGHITNAALHAVRDALREAHAQGNIGILEPFANVQIQCPEAASNAVQHDFVSARGGVISEVRKPDDDAVDTGIDLSRVYVPPDPYDSVDSLRGGKKTMVRMLHVIGKAPLKEMMKYDSHLRSLTGGRHALQLDPGPFELVTGPREKALDKPW